MIRQMRKLRSILNADVLFRLVLGAAFAYMIVGGWGMPRSSFGRPGLYPIFVGIFGLAIWIVLHLQAALRAMLKNRKTGAAGRIYDIAYELGDIPAEVIRRRTVQAFLMLVGLIVAIWLVNFQIAIPLFLLFYLRVVGKTNWWVAVGSMLALEVLIVVLFGDVAHVAWPQSLLEREAGISFQHLLGDPIRRILPL